MSEEIKQSHGKEPLELLSSTALLELARVMEFGRKKYKPHGWRNDQMTISSLLGATLRHVLKLQAGEDKANDSQLLHSAHAMANLMFITEMLLLKRGIDDRYIEKTKDLP